MLDLPYSLVIEATDEPAYFAFYSPELEEFAGIGHSVEDCRYKAKLGMREHMELLRERQLPLPWETFNRRSSFGTSIVAPPSTKGSFTDNWYRTLSICGI